MIELTIQVNIPEEHKLALLELVDDWATAHGGDSWAIRVREAQIRYPSDQPRFGGAKP